MTDLDETALEIGSLKARADGADRNDKLILEKLDEIIDRLAMGDKLLAEHDARVKANHDLLTSEVMPEIRMWRSMRQRAAGATAVIVFSLSIIGSLFTDFISGLVRKLWGAS